MRATIRSALCWATTTGPGHGRGQGTGHGGEAEAEAGVQFGIRTAFDVYCNIWSERHEAISATVRA